MGNGLDGQVKWDIFEYKNSLEKHKLYHLYKKNGKFATLMQKLQELENYVLIPHYTIEELREYKNEFLDTQEKMEKLRPSIVFTFDKDSTSQSNKDTAASESTSQSKKDTAASESTSQSKKDTAASESTSQSKKDTAASESTSQPNKDTDYYKTLELASDILEKDNEGRNRVHIFEKNSEDKESDELQNQYNQSRTAVDVMGENLNEEMFSGLIDFLFR